MAKERSAERNVLMGLLLTRMRASNGEGNVMEFDYRKAFKGIEGKAVNPANPFEQGTAYFTSGQEGEQVQNRMDEMAQNAEMGRRDFFSSACGFAGAMLAVNAATGKIGRASWRERV